MKLIIDRFEGEYAVVELAADLMVNVPRVIIPEGAGEGSTISITLDTDETARRKEKISKLADDLWKD